VIDEHNIASSVLLYF